MDNSLRGIKGLSKGFGTSGSKGLEPIYYSILLYSILFYTNYLITNVYR